MYYTLEASQLPYCTMGDEKMEINFNPLKVISTLPPILISKTNFEQQEIKGDGKMINGIYYFIPEENSLNEAKKNFKIYF